MGETGVMKASGDNAAAEDGGPMRGLGLVVLSVSDLDVEGRPLKR